MSRDARVRALFLKCAALACIAALPVAFSVWIDPARILGARADEQAIARALLAGHNVTNVTNYDDRAIEVLLAKQRKLKPDVLAVGSSRIQALPSSPFPGRRFVNAGVSDGRLGEILGIIGLYDSEQQRPRRVVLNLDPWTLEPLSSNKWSLSLVESHTAMLARLGVPASAWRARLVTLLEECKRLASPAYFRLSVFSWRKYGPAGIRFTVTDSAQSVEKTRTPDGTLVWSLSSPQKEEALARAYVMDMRSGATSSTFDADSSRLLLLERLVRLLRDEGVEVTLLLVPFHPLVFHEFARRAGNPLLAAEARYRALATRSGASVAGGYDPAATSMMASDFFDASHMKPDALARLVTAQR